MNSTKRKAAQPEMPAPQKDTPASWRTFKRRAAAIAIILVASMIPCVAILQNGMSNSASGNSDNVPVSAPRIWGQLEYTPIVIAPPLEFVEDPPSEYYSEGIAWHFSGTSSTRLSALFKSINLSAPLREKLISMAEPNESIRGMSIRPSRQFALNISPEDRAALYIALCAYRVNNSEYAPFQFRGNSTDEWFDGSAVSPTTRKLVEPLIYRRGEFMYFGDFRTIGYLPSHTERSNLLKTLMRNATFIAHLKVSPDSDLEALVKYWGRGGRAHEVRPILEALMRRGGEQAINITHLLPALARRKLYTYPKRSDSDIELRSRDCHWTSMNFFNDVLDDSFCDIRKVNTALQTKYYRISDPLRLGDVIVLFTPQMRFIHSAVYIADDVFFHRCGSRSYEPWALTRRKDLKAYYPSHDKFTVHYYRRKSL
ncbi:MAG: hypothetical protein QGH60_19815 [Phycisphaerae bacterium]|nr:hypothetical protein [Phycisphaerae bacterium]